jgi:hypothetical protein
VGCWASGLRTAASMDPSGSHILPLIKIVRNKMHHCSRLCISLLTEPPVQYSIWELQQRPEFKEKIEKPALERSLQDEPDPKKSKTQWSVRTRLW